MGSDPRVERSMRGEQAVICGASIAGFCAAKVVARHFEKVILVDRDEVDDCASQRHGTPQSDHPHALLNRGRRDLEHLFPGLTDDLLTRGALSLDVGADMVVVDSNGVRMPKTGIPPMLFASRRLVETTLLKYVGEIPNVQFRLNSRVTGVAHGPDARVTGALVGGNDGPQETITSDLLIDASGRSTRFPNWFAAQGLGKVPQRHVASKAAYATVWYDAPDPANRPEWMWWRALMIRALFDPDTSALERCAGVLFPIEGQRWIANLVTMDGAPLPRSVPEFELAVSCLRSPLMSDALAFAAPSTAVFRSRSTDNIWRRYDRWAQRPRRFLAIGDAAAAFNPVFGQGMTSAAMSACLLEDCLRDGTPLDDQVSTFVRGQARLQRAPWLLATARERHASVLGAGWRGRLVGDRLLRMMDTIEEQSDEDERLRRVVYNVVNLTTTPWSALVRPRNLLSALGALRRGRAARRTRPSSSLR